VIGRVFETQERKKKKKELTERAGCVGKTLRSTHKYARFVYQILTEFHRRFKIIIVCFIQKTQNNFRIMHAAMATSGIKPATTGQIHKCSTSIPLEHKRVTYKHLLILEYQLPQFCSESWNTEARDEPVSFLDNPLRLYEEL